MMTSQGKKENGIEVGNHFDKYGSKNPIAKYLMQGFTSALDDLVNYVDVKETHEVGCGEGHLTLRWLNQGLSVRGSDFYTCYSKC